MGRLRGPVVLTIFLITFWTLRTVGQTFYWLISINEIENSKSTTGISRTTTNLQPIASSTDHSMKKADSLFRHQDANQSCLEWNSSDALNRTIQPIDLWWTHHPEYIVSIENATHVCFERSASSHRVSYHVQLYSNQFHTTCETVYQRYMWSSGWGADFSNVIGGMKVAMDRHHVPLIIEWDPSYNERGWHYAANKKDSSNKTCPDADMSCYFLPLHPCNLKSDERRMVIQGNDSITMNPSTSIGLWIYQYLTRPQLWLRRAIWDFKRAAASSMDLSSGECSVIHVRRGDVVLHGDKSRPYYAIEDYVKMLPDEVLQTHNLLLLTDDANAISEALEFYPRLRWKYLDRPRHHGATGGFENQTPSQNPALEVITILATFQWVQKCTHLVHSESSFANMLWDHMTWASRRRQLPTTRKIFQHRVDQRLSRQQKFSSNNMKSGNKLQKRLWEMRRRGRRPPKVG